MATKPFVPGWEQAETVDRSYEGAFASPNHLIFPFPVRYYRPARHDFDADRRSPRYFRDSEAKERDHNHGGP